MGMTADADAAAAEGATLVRIGTALFGPRPCTLLSSATMTAVLVNFLQMLAFVLWLLLIARVVLSWTNPMGGGGLHRPSSTRSPSRSWRRSAASCRRPAGSTGRRWSRC